MRVNRYSIVPKRRDGSIVLSVRDEAGDAGTSRLKAALESSDGSGLGLRVVHAMAIAFEARILDRPFMSRLHAICTLQGL